MKYYSLGSDVTFKYIFGSKKNVHYTEWLLEKLYKLPDGSLKGLLEVQKSFEIDKWRVDGHGYEMDVLVKRLDTLEMINLEVYQDNFAENERIKSYDYANANYSNQLDVGVSYKNSKKLHQINFVSGVNYKSGRFLTKDRNNRKLVKNGIIIDIINIDRPKESGYTIDKELEKMFKLMKAKTAEEAKKIADGTEMIEKMAKDIERFNRDEWISEYFSKENDWKRKVNQGIEDTKLETAKNLLKLGTITIDDIAIATGLNINQVKELQFN